VILLTFDLRRGCGDQPSKSVPGESHRDGTVNVWTEQGAGRTSGNASAFDDQELEHRSRKILVEISRRHGFTQYVWRITG
jgi:hypothetical protein